MLPLVVVSRVRLTTQPESVHLGALRESRWYRIAKEKTRCQLGDQVEFRTGRGHQPQAVSIASALSGRLRASRPSALGPPEGRETAGAAGLQSLRLLFFMQSTQPVRRKSCEPCEAAESSHGGSRWHVRAIGLLRGESISLHRSS